MLLLALAGCGSPAQPVDGGLAGAEARMMMPIDQALGHRLAREHIRRDVTLHFAGQRPPGRGEPFGQPLGEARSRRNSTIVFSDQVSCQKAFLVALEDMQNQARAANADAVVQIKSVHRGSDLASATAFQCDRGGMNVSVTLTGTLAKLKS